MGEPLSDDDVFDYSEDASVPELPTEVDDNANALFVLAGYIKNRERIPLAWMIWLTADGRDRLACAWEACTVPAVLLDLLGAMEMRAGTYCSPRLRAALDVGKESGCRRARHWCAEECERCCREVRDLFPRVDIRPYLESKRG